jgi:hypothetical protein
VKFVAAAFAALQQRSQARTRKTKCVLIKAAAFRRNRGRYVICVLVFTFYIHPYRFEQRLHSQHASSSLDTSAAAACEDHLL